MLPAVSVIVPTRALGRRAGMLRRAIHSILHQEGVRAVPLVVVNGQDRDEGLTRELRANPRLRVTTLDVANLPGALRVGRDMVETDWFAELDDDDVLLPGALALRVHHIQAGPDIDAVITNGFRRSAAGDQLHIEDIVAVERDPVRAMFDRHQYWLLPGSWLCRTHSVGPEFFTHMPQFLECTYLALRLASTRRIVFVDRPTVVWHADTPSSESKSRLFTVGRAAALERMLELDLPPDVRSAIRNRVRQACHKNVRLHLEEGDLKEAWRWHLRSLRHPGRRGYLGYTRHLIYAVLRSRGNAPRSRPGSSS